MDEKPNNIEDIDVNSPDFYEKVQNEIESDMARMKKSLEVVMKLRNMDEKPNNIEDIDVNSPYFYEKVQNEIESDMARMKKSLEVVMKLRMEAAEIEVETAALFHAELFYDVLVIGDESHENSGDEECEKKEDITQKT